MTNFKFGLIVVGVFLVSLISVGGYITSRDPAFQAQMAARRAAEQREAKERAAEVDQYGGPASRQVIEKHLAADLANCRTQAAERAACEEKAQRHATFDRNTYHFYHEPINDYDLQVGHVRAIDHGLEPDQYGRFHDWTKD